jgi:hypothetical protein
MMITTDVVLHRLNSYKKNIIPSISVTDIVFDDYLGNGIIELFPK